MGARGVTTRGEWIAAGIALLRDEGEDALTIERLCKRLDRTKGSFYHHFTDAGAFADALLAHWLDALTVRIIEQAERGDDPRSALARETRNVDVGLELAIRAWSLRDPRARRVMADVDARRVAYLESLWRRSTTPARARALAHIEYAAFVGAQQLYRDMGSRRVRELERVAYEALDDFARK